MSAAAIADLLRRQAIHRGRSRSRAVRIAVRSGITAPFIAPARLRIDRMGQRTSTAHGAGDAARITPKALGYETRGVRGGSLIVGCPTTVHTCTALVRVSGGYAPSLTSNQSGAALRAITHLRPRGTSGTARARRGRSSPPRRAAPTRGIRGSTPLHLRMATLAVARRNRVRDVQATEAAQPSHPRRERHGVARTRRRSSIEPPKPSARDAGALAQRITQRRLRRWPDIGIPARVQQRTNDTLDGKPRMPDMRRTPGW